MDPHTPNVHEIAQAVDPTSRILYIDPDPLVGVHARALHTSHPHGVTDFIPGSLEDIDTALTDQDVLDLHQPVAVLLLAVLHFIPDNQQARRGIERITAAVPPGSYLAVSHATFDPLSAEQAKRLTELAEPGAGHGPFRARTHSEIAALLDGLTPQPPGLVSVVGWQPQRAPRPQITAAQAVAYGVVARKAV